VAVARSSTRPRYYLLLVVLTAITFIAIDHNGNSSIINSVRSASRDAFSPLSDAANSVVNPITNSVSAIFHYGDLKHENDQLRDQLQSLQAAKLQNSQLATDLKEVGQLNNLTFSNDVSGVIARVTDNSSSNFEAAIEIDKGTNDGVAKGFPVVASGGLVGRVVEVSKTRATVQLVTDSSLSVGVRFTRADEVGIAEGNGIGRNLHVDSIAVDADVQKSDALVTSGLQGSVYPADIPVGTVVSAPKPHSGDLQRTVTARPAVDFSHLLFVKVLQWSDSTQ